MQTHPPPVVVDRLRAAARLAPLLVAAIGGMGLLGWLTGIPALQSLIPDRPSMMPNTMFGLFCGALALHLLEPDEIDRGRRLAGVTLAVLVVGLGTITLAQYATGLDLGIDHVLPSVLPTPGPRPIGVSDFPGRPALPTSFCFVALGVALLTLDNRPWRRIHLAESLAAASALVVWAILTGHAYGAELLFRMPEAPATGTALPTAIGLAVLALGVLFARPTRGIMGVVTSERVGGTMARRLLAAAFIGPPLLGLLVLTGERSGGIPKAPFTYAILATASSMLSAALTLRTAASLDLIDEAQRRSEQQYRELFEHASEGIFIADIDGRYTDVNAAGCRLLGMSRADIIGKTIIDLIPPDEVPRLQADRERMIEGGESIADWHLRASDGTLIPVEVSAKILASGRWQGFVRDLRARKAFEGQLAEAHATELRLRMQLEALGNATAAISDAAARVAETDPDTMLRTIASQAKTLVNARYASLGLNGDSKRPFEHWAQVGTPPEKAATRSSLSVPVAYAGRSVGTLELAGKQGASGFSADDQRLIEQLAARAGTALETMRLYREEALAKAWLQAVLDGLPEGVLLADAEGHVSYNAAARALGHDGDADERLRLDLRARTGERLAGADLPLARALRGDAVASLELVAHGNKGQIVPILASASALRDSTGKILGAVCVLHDITPLKQLEQLREQWTAVVAHDLRQPLNLISMSAQVLARASASPPDPFSVKTIARIRAATERLNRMIGDLLDASRIDARKLTLSLDRVDLGRLLADVVDRTTDTGERRIRLRVAPGLPAVHGDHGRIEQILENLLSNAIKYGDPGTDVEIDARLQGNEVVVSTSNQGRGLTPEEMSRLFTRFYRTRSASSVAGIGLGLYITRGLVEAHGGRIWADSEGSTTTFRFTLPALQASQPATAEPLSVRTRN